MKTVTRFVLALVAVAYIVSAASAADKKPQELIVGKWLMEDPKKKIKATIEFTNDGKVTVQANDKGAEFKLEGKYKFVDDKTIEFTMEGKDAEENTIKSLSETDLVLLDKRGKDEIKLHRVQ